MKYRALASDYDGTLAIEGVLHPDMVRALRQLRETGCKLILVTGRVQEDFERVCGHLDIFHKIVFENGALLYTPESGELEYLTQKVPQELIELLTENLKTPIFVGRCILATQAIHQSKVQQCLDKFDTPYSITLNKDSAMILPTGVHKGSGLKAALRTFNIPSSQTLGMGDGENDEPLLEACGMSYAVADSTPGLLAIADAVMSRGAHHGPLQIIRRIIQAEPLKS